MPVTHVGTVGTVIYDHYVRERGCANTTFIVPRDTNTLARLVEVVVQPGDLVLDLGCGDGIATIHAASRGAASIAGIDVNPAAVSTARNNAQRMYPSLAEVMGTSLVGAGLQTRPQPAAAAIRIERMNMSEVLIDEAARAALLQRCGFDGRTIDVVISNPPYVPMDGMLAWNRRDNEALQALPVTDLGVLGRSDALLERVTTLRAAMMAAEDGGADGLRFVREILEHGPRFARRLAWLQGSYSSPLAVLELIERNDLHIETLLAYATPFGPRTSSAPSAQQTYLSELRARGEAFYWIASPDGPHWMLLLGFSVRPGEAPSRYSWPAVHASLRRLLEAFAARGPASLAQWIDDVPFEMETGCYELL